MFTRKQYMNNECSHNEYYAQFVNKQIIDHVSRNIGKTRIIASKDEHFNDIPLKEWDRLNKSIKALVSHDVKRKLDESGRFFLWSLSDGVCISKQAARMIRNNEQ